MDWLKRNQRWVTIGAITIITGLICWFLFMWRYEFSSFGFGLLMGSIVLILLFVTDKFVMHEYDTLNEIGKGNVAAAIGFLAIVILYVGCIGAAFIVFK